MANKVFRSVDDTFVQQKTPDLELSSYNYIGIGRQSTADSGAVAIIRFPNNGNAWNTLPPSSSITSAYMWLYCSSNGYGPQIFTARVNSFPSWPNYVTWNNAPWGGDRDGYTYDPSSAYGLERKFVLKEGEWTQVNITPYIRNCIDHAWLIDKGLRIRQDGYSAARSYVLSSESANPPYLVINYSVDTPTVTSKSYSADGRTVSYVGTADRSADQIFARESTILNGTSDPVGEATYNQTYGNWNFSHTPDLASSVRPGAFTLNPPSSSSRDIILNWSSAPKGSDDLFYIFRGYTQGEGSSFTAANRATISPNINRYEIYRNGNKIGQVSSTSYRDTGAPIDSNLSYSIRAVDVANNDRYSNTRSIIISRPDPPTFTSLVANAQNDTLVLQGGRAPTTGLAGFPRTVNVNPSLDGGQTYPSSLIRKISQFDASGGWSYNYPVAGKSPVSVNVSDNQTLEGYIGLSWNKPINPSTNYYFKISLTKDGLDSGYTVEREFNHTPTITKYRIRKKLYGDPDSKYAPIGGNFVTQEAYSDNAVDFGKKYTYEIIAYNNLGLASPPSIFTTSLKPPLAPTINSTETRDNADSSQSVLIKGSKPKVTGLSESAVTQIQRSQTSGLWTSLSGRVSNVTSDTHDWELTDNDLNVTRPTKPLWYSTTSSSVIPSDGGNEQINLKWKPSTNSRSVYSYRALRQVNGFLGTPSGISEIIIQPRLTTYDIYRRRSQSSPGGLPGEYNWLKLTSTGRLYYQDIDYLSGVSYEYQLTSNNNFDLISDYSPILTVKTSSPVTLPPEIPPTPPIISKLSPSGLVDISSNSILRISWDYTQDQDSAQAYFKLYRQSSTLKEYWTNAGWVTIDSPDTLIPSNITNVEVSSTGFDLANSFTLGLYVVSENGGTSSVVTSIISPSETGTDYYDLLRSISKIYTETFDLHRKIRNNITNTNLPSILVQWDVEEKLPLEVRDTNWEGGGNTLQYVVFDNGGRPEPYAELDFVRDRITTTFNCDSRGRILLTVSNKMDPTSNLILPGIYLLRERGPSMAPRTTENHVVVDPGIVYRHGHRHSSDGPDPIFGITKDQIDPKANIPLEVLSGGKSLKIFVDKYGSDIESGIEETVSSGYGFFVVNGMNTQISAGDLSVMTGSCWENNRYRTFTDTIITPSQSGTYKVYVSNNTILVENRSSFPPGSCPLSTVSVTVDSLSLKIINPSSIIDERIYHPSNTSPNTSTPIIWGPETTDDILHGDRPLVDVLNENIFFLNKQVSSQDKISNDFYSSNQKTIDTISQYEEGKYLARKVNLSVGYTTAMRSIYTLFDKREADNLLLDEGDRLENLGMIDIYNYLNEQRSNTSPQSHGNISVFGSKDELSSLSNVISRNGVATLPNNWSIDSEYTMRTLVLDVPPSKILEFHLIYEDIKSIFSVRSSIGNNGIYIPKNMSLIKTIKDSSLKSILGVTNECYINTYRCEFDREGNEAVIDLKALGTSNNDGIRLRGWAVVCA